MPVIDEHSWNQRQFRFGTGAGVQRKIGTATTAVTIEASIQAEIQGNGYLQYVNLSAGTSTSKVAILKISNVPQCAVDRRRST